MKYGVSYYPEHKGLEELQVDIKHIIESGINTVRMGEFAWCRFEPEEGKYQFDWLDLAIEEFGKHGIQTIVCTPTACPPAWMIDKHPDILYVDNRGITRPFGGRRHYCYNNEAYRAYSATIANEIGKRYGSHPYVIGFQIDNEPAQEGTGRCHCSVCSEKFQGYLKEKYHYNIAEFNERSGGVFWSQEYSSFAQIQIPVNTIEVGTQQQIGNFYENPTVRLEFERFASDSQIDYQNIQADILKGYTKAFVTTNATGLATNSIDYYKGTKNLDTYAFDFYPGLRNTSVDSFPYAFARGVKEGVPFGVMEFMSGGGHRFSGSGRQQPNPGALKQAVFQSLAQGADLMLHFQYRTFPFGAEQLNYAIVDMDGIPRRRYYEMQETAALLKEIENYEKSTFKKEVAILVDYDTHWALRIKPVNDPLFDYLSYCGEIYKGLQEEGIPADVKSYHCNFEDYRVIILPAAFILQKSHREKCKQYVENGGTLLATFLTSAKNEDNVGYTETLPAGLTELFGITVEEVEPIFEDNKAAIQIKAGEFTCESEDFAWCDLLKGSAEMLGIYGDTYKAGSGIISKNKFGKGTSYYLGTGISKEALRGLLKYICKEAKVETVPFEIPEKVEVVLREWEGKNLYYFINFTGKSVEIALEEGVIYEDCIKNATITKSLCIEPQGFALLKEKKND